ncbi:MAG: hypothetical protein JOZ76_08245 [Bradyrhizobium sp.]|nr:hypothetical protein [Bradyrhizobium sp.]
MADVSFGVEAAARQFELDFVRLPTEDYFFVCRQIFLETEPMRRVLDIMRGGGFHRAIAALPGAHCLRRRLPTLGISLKLVVGRT